MISPMTKHGATTKIRRQIFFLESWQNFNSLEEGSSGSSKKKKHGRETRWGHLSNGLLCSHDTAVNTDGWHVPGCDYEYRKPTGVIRAYQNNNAERNRRACPQAFY